jgi:glycosyltransferase involved in cell wall biosynthesis
MPVSQQNPSAQRSSRSLLFLVPGTTGQFSCGGLFAELKAMKLAQQVVQAEVVTYRQREKQTLFLPDLLAEGMRRDRIFVVSWGFDVPKLLRQLKGHHVVYHAHSAGYGFRISPFVPILTVSRNTMGYWGQYAPHSPIYYLPNQISDEFTDRNLPRDIDVLVQARKTSDYVLRSLIPALEQQCHVKVLSGFVPDLGELFNRSKVYLYDSAEYWAQQRVSEGFGLPPMEAMASGCHVFSSVNHALSDYLDPGFNAYKIASYSTDYDVQRIIECINSRSPLQLPTDFLDEYRSHNIVKRWDMILQELNTFFNYAENNDFDLPEMTEWRLQKLRLRSFFQKVKRKLGKL